jgi:predicted phosphate transport protein (TIGR00153 family)
LERKSYTWFERKRRTKALDLAQEQMSKALYTVTLLNDAIQEFLKANKNKAMEHVKNLMAVEKEVDRLRTQVFKELSKGVALFAEYREDLLHLVNRLDTLADHVKDAARCIKMLLESEIPKELWKKTAHMVSILVKCANALRGSLEQIAANPEQAREGAKEVEDIETVIDQEYLETKSLFIKYGGQINSGSMVIFDHLVEFIEHAADMCADTADYIVVLSSGK